MVYYTQNGYSVLDSISDCYEHKLPDGVVLPLRRGSAGYVLQHFARRFHERVEPLGRTETFGYNKRRISGTSEWSNHASATAEDLNSSQHPYGKVGTFTERQVRILRDLLDDYDDVIRWGGDYRYSKDEMHFEINEPQGKVNVLAQRLRRKNVVYLDRLLPGKRNIDVYMVKRELDRRGMFTGTMTKYFGKGLTGDYARWQRSLGYSGSGADGIPGRTSLEALGFTVK